MDLIADRLKRAPNHVTKMIINEIFGDLSPHKKLETITFKNKKHNEMLVEKGIVIHATCQQHLLSMIFS
jgi:GTP cyclohydrolase I